MAIPLGEVELRDIDVQHLSIDDMALLVDPKSLDDSEFIGIFRRFCLEHTNWTRRQIGQITAGEIGEVIAKFSAALKALAVPKEPQPNSEPGPTVTT